MGSTCVSICAADRPERSVLAQTSRIWLTTASASTGERSGFIRLAFSPPHAQAISTRNSASQPAQLRRVRQVQAGAWQAAGARAQPRCSPRASRGPANRAPSEGQRCGGSWTSRRAAEPRWSPLGRGVAAHVSRGLGGASALDGNARVPIAPRLDGPRPGLPLNVSLVHGSSRLVSGRRQPASARQPSQQPWQTARPSCRRALGPLTARSRRRWQGALASALAGATARGRGLGSPAARPTPLSTRAGGQLVPAEHRRPR